MAGGKTMIPVGVGVRFCVPGFGREKGSVLVPCMLLLSVISVTAIGFLSLSQTAVRGTAAWDKDYRARLAAFSGKEYALLQLNADLDYTGVTGLNLPGGAGSIDVAVTVVGPKERHIQVSSSFGTARSEIQVDVRFEPRALKYSMTVLGDLDLLDTCRILGDLYVMGDFKGDSTAVVTGDVYLHGSRALLLDVGGKVIAVDGKTVPFIGGTVYDNQDFLTPVDGAAAALNTLKTRAIAQGQYFTGSTQTLTNQDFTGVVFIAAGTDVEFKNVTIFGILVVEPLTTTPTVFAGENDTDSLLTVKDGFYLKVISDPAQAEDLAIFAPTSTLKIEKNTYLDTVGAVIAGYGRFKKDGSAVLTGPLVVNGGVNCEGALLFQSPESTRDRVPSAVVFKEYEQIETGYIEP